MYNNGCCMPPTPKKDNCSCKDGIICALDYFFQDFLSVPSIIKLGTLKYYPILPSVPNVIYGIPYISPDIVPIYIDEPTEGALPSDPYCGDITYLNICEIEGFEFELELPPGVARSSIEAGITTMYSKIKYCSPGSSCCKNGLMEILLKARDYLKNPCICGEGATTDVSVTISTCKMSYNITEILAINPDTVWAKEFIPATDEEEDKTIYYVISLCKIVGITFNRTNPRSLETPEEDTTVQSLDVLEQRIVSYTLDELDDEVVVLSELDEVDILNEKIVSYTPDEFDKTEEINDESSESKE